MMQRYTIFFILLFRSPLLTEAQHASLEFVENRGQWDGGFLYKATNANSAIFLEKDGFTYKIGAAQNHELVHDFKHNKIKTAPVLRYHAYRVFFEGASAAVTLSEAKSQKHYYNYFLGKAP